MAPYLSFFRVCFKEVIGNNEISVWCRLADGKWAGCYKMFVEISFLFIEGMERGWQSYFKQ
jgi:hypothetical protein